MDQHLNRRMAAGIKDILNQRMTAGIKDIREITVMVLVKVVIMEILKMGKCKESEVGSYLILPISHQFLFFTVFNVFERYLLYELYLNILLAA
jgi:hypothetical protein